MYGIEVDRPVVAYYGRTGRDAVAHVLVVPDDSEQEPSGANGTPA